MLAQTLDKMTKMYATLKIVEYGAELEKEMSRHYQEIKLTKRIVTFVVLNGPTNPELLPAGSRHVVLSENPAFDFEVKIGEGVSEKELQSGLIRSLQLDSVWVGLLCRIGTDVDDFISHLNSVENFELFEVGVIDLFLQYMEEEMKSKKKGSGGIALFKRCFNRTTSPENLVFFNRQIEEMVRSKFNRRVVFTDITSHSYLNLLTSRGYFNLVFLEQDIVSRFHHFRQQLSSKKHTQLLAHLSLEMFILLDDFVPVRPLRCTPTSSSPL